MTRRLPSRILITRVSEDLLEAAHWFDMVGIGETDRVKIGRANALKLFKLRGTVVEGTAD